MESQTSHCVTYIPQCHAYVAVFLFGFQRCLYASIILFLLFLLVLQSYVGPNIQQICMQSIKGLHQ